MKLIVGLGNPDTEYQQTRHNAGWAVFASDAFKQRYMSVTNQNFSAAEKFHAEIFKSGEAIFAKSTTYMNLSGHAVKKLCTYYRIEPRTELLVIHDDVDLALGTWKHSYDASSAGHNGVQSIIEALGTQEFHRIRIGIENRADKKIPPTEAFVLQPFRPEEQPQLTGVIKAVVGQIATFIAN